VRYDALDRRFTALHPELKKLGIRVWSCTKGSGLTAFPHMPFEKAVERAVLGDAECLRLAALRGMLALPEPVAFAVVASAASGHPRLSCALSRSLA